MNDFKPGELVDITIRSVRIESIDDVGLAQCSLPKHAWRPSVNLRADGVEVTRIAPVEWPPRHGDLWRDSHGRLWAGMQITAADDDTADEPYCVLVVLQASMRSRSQEPEHVLQDFGPMVLKHREGGEG